MTFEHSIKVLPIDGDLQAEVENLHKLGWELMPEVLPVAVYHLVRVKHEAKHEADAVTAVGNLIFDDSKVFIIPPGQKPQ
jgi:hypothetical protein